MRPGSHVFADVFFESGQASGVAEVELMTGEFEHELAIITVGNDHPTSKRFASGAPVRIDWGVAPIFKRSFIGYVNHVVPMKHPSGDLTSDSPEGHMQVVCVAPTWVFKSGEMATFRGMTATTVIKRIAEEARFDTRHLRPHSKVWPVHHQGEKTDWEFMVECAQKIGWTLFARGLELHCIDRKKAIEQARTYAPVLQPGTAGGLITKMRNSLGATSPQGGDLKVRDAWSVNPRNGRVLHRRNSANTDRSMFRAMPVEPTLQRAVSVVFDSLDEADTKLGATEALNRMAVEATLEGGLNPRVRVGGAVFVDGMADGNNGHWYVRSANFKLKGLRSTMRLTLGRDTEREDTSVVPVGAVAPVPRGARLVNRQWVLG